jgi:hypothetical protein
LLVVIEGRGGVGAVDALARVLQVGLRVLAGAIVGGRETTYRSALVAVAGNVGLSAAQINARVDVRLAPQGTVVLVDEAGGDAAARDGRVEGRVALGRREANKRRGGDDKSRVEHGWECREYRCLCSGVSGRSAVAAVVLRGGRGNVREECESGWGSRPDIDARGQTYRCGGNAFGTGPIESML